MNQSPKIAYLACLQALSRSLIKDAGKCIADELSSVTAHLFAHTHKARAVTLSQRSRPHNMKIIYSNLKDNALTPKGRKKGYWSIPLNHIAKVQKIPIRCTKITDFFSQKMLIRL
jgi:hypothetical protein